MYFNNGRMFFFWLDPLIILTLSTKKVKWWSQCLIGCCINLHKLNGQGFLYWADLKKTQARPAPAAWQQGTSQANNQRNTWSPADLWYQQVSSMGAMTSGWDCFWAEIFRNMWWLKKRPCFIHILLYMRNLALQYSTVCKI